MICVVFKKKFAVGDEKCSKTGIKVIVAYLTISTAYLKMGGFHGIYIYFVKKKP